MTIDQFIELSTAQESEQQLFNLLMGELQNHGYDQAIFNLYTNHHVLHLVAENGLLSQTPNVDSYWLSQYRNGFYNDYDPFRAHCFYGQGILTREELKTVISLRPEQVQLLKDTEAAGFHNRITIAFRGGSGAVAGLDLGTSTEEAKPRSVGAAVYVICQQFYQCFWQLKQSNDEQTWLTLTGKEREVLEWSAKGFTKAEIGARLHISSHTVDYHSRKLARKLGARNITAAAVTALNRGLIHV